MKVIILLGVLSQIICSSLGALQIDPKSRYKFGSFRGIPHTVNPRNSNPSKADRVQVGSLNLPTVGCGTISWFSNDRSDDEKLDDLIEDAVSLSYDFFDTAERYGKGKSEAFGQGWGGCEQVLGEKIGNIPDNQITVGTKFTPTPWRSDANSVVKACEDSRKRLGVDVIDLYQIHMPDIVQPLRMFGLEQVKDEKYWDGIAECYKRGYISNVGVCNYGPTLLARAAEHLDKQGVPLASNQINYSLLYTGNGAQMTLDYGKSLGIKTFAYYPLAMGLLSGKYSSTNSIRMRADVTTAKTKLELTELKRCQQIEPLLQVLETIAQKRNKSIAQVALNWIICKGAIPIPGARTPRQSRDNAGARGWRLSGREVLLLDITAESLNYSFEGAGFKRSSEKFVGYGMEKWSLS